MPALLKMLATALVAIVAIVAAGLLGLTFYAWPTNIGDHQLPVTQEVLDQLIQLKAERKFQPNSQTFYFGAPNEQARAAAQSTVDSVIDSLLTGLPASPRSSFVLGQLKVGMSAFPSPESEERDQFLIYLQRIMAIVGVKSSSELLNVWRYGFPYGWFIKNKSQEK